MSDLDRVSDSGQPGRPMRHHCDHYADHRYDHLRNRKYGDEEVDVCIVGAGAAGGVLAYLLAKAGLKVVVIEAGPYWDPVTDFASDELEMQKLGWQQTRIVAGNDPLTMGHNNSGRGVGGHALHRRLPSLSRERLHDVHRRRCRGRLATAV